jgi:hypothetical protein
MNARHPADKLEAAKCDLINTRMQISPTVTMDSIEGRTRLALLGAVVDAG